mmetsp:Transcript_60779/g.168497  ORF Transcript_60779/g.168497 Transcript_60779/m.168497 type:complete len:111 (+) Transcript_60779:274-606(+)
MQPQVCRFMASSFVVARNTRTYLLLAYCVPPAGRNGSYGAGAPTARDADARRRRVAKRSNAGSANSGSVAAAAATAARGLLRVLTGSAGCNSKCFVAPFSHQVPPQWLVH